MTDRRVDLARARREAKALLKAARAGDPAALGRLRADREPRLADAQHAVARDLGASSWPALVRGVEAQAAAEARALLDACRAGDHEGALALARAHPQAAERVRRMSPSSAHPRRPRGSCRRRVRAAGGRRPGQRPRS
jgi:DNA-binding GntR family transcriptional regulator